MIAKEFDRSGIPTSQISALTQVAIKVGSNRIVPGVGIMYPVGDPNLPPEEEMKLRRLLIEKAVNALQINLQEQKIF